MDVTSNGGKILSIVIDSGGTGYTSAPSVTIQNTTQNNTYGNIRIINAGLKPYSGRASVKKSTQVTFLSTVEFISIRDKSMGTLYSYYKEYATKNIENEVPTGTINGINTNFTLTNTPVSGNENVYLNGMRQKNTVDYTISNNIITFISAPIA